MMLTSDQMRSHTEKMVQALEAAGIRIDRKIDRADLATALLFREALRSLERFAEADLIRQKLAHYGFMVRDEDRSSKNPGYFVILGDDKRCIIDRGWVPTYSLMQQYLLHQCSLEKVFAWMWGASDSAGVGQFPRHAEHPTLYATMRMGNEFVCEGTSYEARMKEDAGHGGKGRGYAPSYPKASAQRTEECKRSEAGVADQEPAAGQSSTGEQDQAMAQELPCSSVTGIADAGAEAGRAANGSPETVAASEEVALADDAQHEAEPTAGGSRAVTPDQAGNVASRAGMAAQAALGNDGVALGDGDPTQQDASVQEQRRQAEHLARWKGLEGTQAGASDPEPVRPAIADCESWEGDDYRPQVTYPRATLGPRTVHCLDLMGGHSRGMQDGPGPSTGTCECCSCR